MDRASATDRLGVARVARMATVDGRGRARLVPVVFALEEGLLFWAVDQKPKRSTHLGRLRDIAANPRVELIVDHYEDDDWDRLWWVRASGPAEVVHDPGERAHALALLARKYRQHGERPPEGPVVRIRLDRLTWWDGSPSEGSPR